MVKKEKEEDKPQIHKLGKTERNILVDIDKTSKWEDLKDVKVINDEIIKLDIYKDFIGLGCSKYIRESGVKGEIDIEEMFRNCREAEKVRQRVKKAEKREEMKQMKQSGRSRGGGGRGATLPKQTPVKDIKEVIDKAPRLTQAEIKSISKAWDKAYEENNGDISKSLLSTAVNYSGLMCLNGGLQGVSSILYGISSSFTSGNGKIGYENGNWTMNNNIYDGFKEIVSKCGGLAMIYGGAKLMDYLNFKGWWVVDEVVEKGDKPKPTPKDFKKGGTDKKDDDDDDDEDKGDDKGDATKIRKEEDFEIVDKPQGQQEEIRQVVNSLMTTQQRAQTQVLEQQNINRMFQQDIQNNPLPTGTLPPVQQPRVNANLQPNIPTNTESLNPSTTMNIMTGMGTLGATTGILGGLYGLYDYYIGNPPLQPQPTPQPQPITPIPQENINYDTIELRHDDFEADTRDLLNQQQEDLIGKEKDPKVKEGYDELEKERQEHEEKFKKLKQKADEEQRKREEQEKKVKDYMEDSGRHGQAWGLLFGGGLGGKLGDMSAIDSLTSSLPIMGQMLDDQENLITDLTRRQEIRLKEHEDAQEQLKTELEEAEVNKMTAIDELGKQISLKKTAKKEKELQQELVKQRNEQIAKLTREKKEASKKILAYPIDTDIRQQWGGSGAKITNPLNLLLYQTGDKVERGTRLGSELDRVRIGIGRFLENYTMLNDVQQNRLIELVLQPLNNLNNAGEQRELVSSIIRHIDIYSTQNLNEGRIPYWRTGQSRLEFINTLRSLTTTREPFELQEYREGYRRPPDEDADAGQPPPE